MGAPSEWLDVRQQEQVQSVKKAYAEVQSNEPRHQKKIFSEIKTDGVDYAYAWARTFTPSWVMLLIFVVGLVTLIPAFLRKFGIAIKLNVEKTKDN